MVAELILTGALVLATTVLAWYTMVMAKAIQYQYDWTIRPIIAVSLDFIGTKVIFLQFENVGNGYASDVRVKVSSEPPGLDFEWDYPGLLPHQSASARPPGDYINWDKMKTLDRLVMTIQCRDINGYSRPSTLTLEIRPFRESQAWTRHVESERELVEKGVEYLGTIAKQMGNLVVAAGRGSRDNTQLP